MRWSSTLGPTVLVLGVAAALLAGCSSSGDDVSSTSDDERPTTTGLVRPSTTTSEGSTTSEPTITLAPSPSSPSDGRGLRFRPVIGSELCSAVTPDPPPGDGPPPTTIPPPGHRVLVPSEDGALCYDLGPVAATGEDLARAAADTVPQTGGWTVLVTPKPEAETKLNELFDACFVGAPTCPAQGANGSVAIELDGKVVSAPAVAAEGLASSPFQISAVFTELEAQALAARLNG